MGFCELDLVGQVDGFLYFRLTEEGTAYSFGENKLGQLGQGNQTDAVLSPAAVSLPSPVRNG